MRQDFRGVIYKITNNKNGKTYIGQTYRMGGFNARYPYNGEGIKRVYNTLNAQRRRGGNYNHHLLRSIEKYGFKEFSVDCELDTAQSPQELSDKEVFWIKALHSTDPEFGYNKAAGGEGNKFDKNIYISGYKKGIYKPFICLETRELFLTANEASDRLNVDKSGILRNLKGKQNHVGSHSHDGKYSFKFIDLEKDSKPIVLVNTGEYFLTTHQAYLKTGVQWNSIKRCCDNSKDKSRYGGKCQDTYEKLVWMYQIDYKFEDWGNRYRFAYKTKIVQLTSDNKYINEWDNKKDASKDLMLRESRVHEVCNSKNKNIGNGYRLMFKEDYLDMCKMDNSNLISL